MLKKLKSLASFFLVPAMVLSLCQTAGLHSVFADEPSDSTSIAVNTEWPAYPSIYAEAGVLIDAASGTVLYEKNGYSQMYPASITKIMTTMLALEYGNLSEMVEFSHYSVYSLESGAAHVSMDQGELLSMNDCLYAIMLASANEVSNAVAEHIAKKQPEYEKRIAELDAAGQEYNDSVVAIQVFAEMMNSRAVQCGARNTHFCNPNGLFDENHFTTCYDMAMITREAIKNDQFLKVESQLTYTLPTTNLKTETQPIANRHKMLFPLNAVYYEGILGGKTGYVDQSGNTLVTFARRNGMTLISVVMRSNSQNVYNDTKLLLDYGFNNFSLTNISQNETNFTPSNNSYIFSSNSSLIKISPDDYVILPNSVSLEQCSSHLTFSEENPDIFARLEYTLGDRSVGSATLTVNREENNRFEFGPKIEEETKKEPVDNDYITINLRVVLAVSVIILVILLILYFFKSSRISRNRRRRNKRNIYR